MRFAGAPEITSFLNKNKPDFGAMSQSMDDFRSQSEQASIGLQGQVGAQGISAAGEVEAAGIMADAQAGVAQAQGNAAMMEGIGGIASSAIGAFGGGGGMGGSSMGSFGAKSYPSYVNFNAPAVGGF